MVIKYIADPIAAALGDWASQLNIYSVLLRICLSIAFSAAIGCERSSKRHAAGLRTFILAALATTLAMLLDLYLAALSGSAFFVISAASIIALATISVNSILFSSRSQIKGLTTSMGLWACGIVGLTVGAGLYTVTIVSALALICGLSFFPTFEKYLKNRSNHFEIHIELKSSSYLRDFVTTIRQLGIKIDDIESNPAYANSGLSVYTVAVSIKSAELKKYKTHNDIVEALKTLDYIYHIEELIN